MLRHRPWKSDVAVDDDLVDAGLLGVDRAWRGILLQPAAERRAAGEIHDRDFRIACASLCAIGAVASSAASMTTFGSKPASFSTSRAILTVIASGRIAPGCGFTIDALPVARLAKIAG